MISVLCNFLPLLPQFVEGRLDTRPCSPYHSFEIILILPNFLSSQTSKRLLVLKTSSTRLQDMSWRHLQYVFSIIILRLPRRLEEVLKTSCKTKNCYTEDVLKTCLQDVLKTYLEDVLKTLWRETKDLMGISVSNKSECVSNKFIFHESISDNFKANPKCIN